MALNSPMMQICVYAGMAFVLSFGSYLVISSQGTEVAVGQMSAILTYSFQILMSLMSLNPMNCLKKCLKESCSICPVNQNNM